MLLMRVRVKPCKERDWRSSLGRLTSTVPSTDRATVIGAATTCCNWPLGPLTVTACPSMDTSTPDGTGTGSRPIRDMTTPPLPLPDVGENFSAYTVFGRLLVSQQAGGRGNDGHTETAENLGKARRPGIDAQARLGHPTHTSDGTLAVGAVLQVDGQRLADFGFADPPARYVTLGLQNLSDMGLELGERHGDHVVVRRVGVPDAGQHIRNRV